MPTLFIQGVVLFSSVACLAYGFSTLIRMNRVTNHGIRLAFIAIATGAFAEIVAILGGYVPTFPEAVLYVGIGLLTVFGRREHYAKHCPYAPKDMPKPDYGRRWQDSVLEPDLEDTLHVNFTKGKH